MPKFAPVAPIQVLEGLWAAGPECFGNYHLLLAHHTVEHKTRFTALFKAIAEADHVCTIIMDNSIVELGDAVGPEMVAEAVACVDQGGLIGVGRLREVRAITGLVCPYRHQTARRRNPGI